MNKNRKWLLALSVAGLITANGIAMAAVDTEQQDGAKTQRPAFADRMNHDGMRAHKGEIKPLLDLLNIDAATFKTEIQSGKTLVVISSEHGVSEEALKDFIKNQMTQHLDKAVVDGKIAQDKADQMKSNMDERINKMINAKAPMQDGNHRMAKFDHKELLALLKMDVDTLKTEMKSGKTLAEIAGEQGVSEQALKDVIKQQMTQRLDKAVENGKIPQDKAVAIKANMDERIDKMIHAKKPMHDEMKNKAEKTENQNTENESM